MRDNLICSEDNYLHFPYPEGWSTELADLEEIMRRRCHRFQDRSQSLYLEEDQRLKLIKVHTQAMDAIKEVVQG